MGCLLFLALAFSSPEPPSQPAPSVSGHVAETVEILRLTVQSRDGTRQIIETAPGCEFTWEGKQVSSADARKRLADRRRGDVGVRATLRDGAAVRVELWFAGTDRK